MTNMIGTTTDSGAFFFTRLRPAPYRRRYAVLTIEAGDVGIVWSDAPKRWFAYGAHGQPALNDLGPFLTRLAAARALTEGV